MIIYQVANTISNDCDNCLITTQRKQYITLGYEPIPCRGKIPVSKSWQNIRIDFDTIAFWGDEYPEAVNTGIRTRYAPAIDIDVYDGEMVDKIRQELLNLIPSGSILERIGQLPKVLIPFQGAVPFNKIAIAFKGHEAASRRRLQAGDARTRRSLRGDGDRTGQRRRIRAPARRSAGLGSGAADRGESVRVQ